MIENTTILIDILLGKDIEGDQGKDFLIFDKSREEKWPLIFFLELGFKCSVKYFYFKINT